jgi:hypothetical protein
MTEKTTQEVTQENNGINISVEQILAAIIATVGETTVTLETLVANYADKTISVNQLEDKSVKFTLVDIAEAQPATTEETAE